MSSSAIGLGAAALGAASLGAKSLKNRPGKMVKVPQPSAEDFLKGKMGLIYGDTNKFYASPNAMIKAASGTGPIIGASGQFYYGGAPTRVPKGFTALRGPDISVQGTNKNSGSYTSSVETYRLVPLQQTQPQEQPKTQPSTETQGQPSQQLKLDLTQGGKKNVLNRADIKYAKEQGATRSEIRQAVESQDIRMSAKAKARLYKEKKAQA